MWILLKESAYLLCKLSKLLGLTAFWSHTVNCLGSVNCLASVNCLGSVLNLCSRAIEVLLELRTQSAVNSWSDIVFPVFFPMDGKTVKRRSASSLFLPSPLAVVFDVIYQIKICVNPLASVSKSFIH
mmetsp:Transcript_59486/g.98625  ORF Transcript_59486/g.98625 Transcript_59486/m.98625 type:complete len:127 (+) Transcript_59486:372-752(+)